VPTEEVARSQYKTVLIIFHLNLQTITITLDVVKWPKTETIGAWRTAAGYAQLTDFINLIYEYSFISSTIW